MPITSYGVIGQLGAALASAQPGPQSLAALAPILDSRLPAGGAEKLDFLGMPPKMREWIGKRKSKRLLEFLYSVVMAKFESTMELPLDWTNNDKTGLVAQRIQQMVSRIMGWRADLIARRINLGASEVGFDGVNFFSASHVMGDSGTQSNVLTKTSAVTDTPTALEAAEAILESWARMTGFLDDAGEPMREEISDLAIVVPPAMAPAHMQALTAERVDTGSGTVDNPLAGIRASGVTVRLISTPRITVSRATLVNTSPGASAFLMFENPDELSIKSKAEGSDFEFDNDAHEYGIKAVGQSGYGLFADAIQITYSA